MCSCCALCATKRGVCMCAPVVKSGFAFTEIFVGHFYDLHVVQIIVVLFRC